MTQTPTLKDHARQLAGIRRRGEHAAECAAAETLIPRSTAILKNDDIGRPDE